MEVFRIAWILDVEVLYSILAQEEHCRMNIATEGAGLETITRSDGVSVVHNTVDVGTNEVYRLRLCDEPELRLVREPSWPQEPLPKMLASSVHSLIVFCSSPSSVPFELIKAARCNKSLRGTW